MRVEIEKNSMWCHILAAIGAFIAVPTCIYLSGADEDSRISAMIGLGFGQISPIAIWCASGLPGATSSRQLM